MNNTEQVANKTFANNRLIHPPPRPRYPITPHEEGVLMELRCGRKPTLHRLWRFNANERRGVGADAEHLARDLAADEVGALRLELIAAIGDAAVPPVRQRADIEPFDLLADVLELVAITSTTSCIVLPGRPTCRRTGCGV